ncbi:MAG: sigma-70 family RNA polymerase sigma factor [Acidobacteriia bacterium]|nr:sigma-70 family RNA polymerase sigma factor [Terriglobia bacterium]
MTQADAGTPDEILVVAAILGDLAAFDVLARRYRSAVFRTARTIVPPEDADDVAQEALLLAFKALPSLEEPAKFPAWLHAITRRCALRYQDRSRAHHRGRVALDEAILQQVPALGRRSAGHGRAEELNWALEGIPQDYGLVLRLHFFDEMPLKRIAGFLGISLATAKWRVFHGKKLLREQFEALQQRKTEKWKEKKR